MLGSLKKEESNLDTRRENKPMNKRIISLSLTTALLFNTIPYTAIAYGNAMKIQQTESDLYKRCCDEVDQIKDSSELPTEEVDKCFKIVSNLYSSYQTQGSFRTMKQLYNDMLQSPEGDWALCNWAAGISGDYKSLIELKTFLMNRDSFNETEIGILKRVKMLYENLDFKIVENISNLYCSWSHLDMDKYFISICINTYIDYCYWIDNGLFEIQFPEDIFGKTIMKHDISNLAKGEQNKLKAEIIKIRKTPPFEELNLNTGEAVDNIYLHTLWDIGNVDSVDENLDKAFSAVYDLYGYTKSRETIKWAGTMEKETDNHLMSS